MFVEHQSCTSFMTKSPCSRVHSWEVPQQQTPSFGDTRVSFAGTVLPHGISEEGDFHVVMCVIADIDMLFFSIIFSSTAVVKDEKHVTCPFPLRHV